MPNTKPILEVAREIVTAEKLSHQYPETFVRLAQEVIDTHAELKRLRERLYEMDDTF